MKISKLWIIPALFFFCLFFYATFYNYGRSLDTPESFEVFLNDLREDPTPIADGYTMESLKALHKDDRDYHKDFAYLFFALTLISPVLVFLMAFYPLTKDPYGVE